MSCLQGFRNWGMPMHWTTDDPSNEMYHKENIWGSDYWLAEFKMNCCENPELMVKGFVAQQDQYWWGWWENLDRREGECAMEGNHLAQ